TVRIIAADVGKIEKIYGDSAEVVLLGEPRLKLKIEITNHSATRKIDYRAWGGLGFAELKDLEQAKREATTVTDEFGNTLKIFPLNWLATSDSKVVGYGGGA